MAEPAMEASHGKNQRLRIMGLDGSTLEVADEAANANHFEYPGASRGTAAFPQMRFWALVECGTQVLIGAKVGTYATGEQTLAQKVLDHADKSMLVIADRRFAGYPRSSTRYCWRMLRSAL